MSTVPVQELRVAAKPAVLDHFLALAPEDRRLRFGSPLGDEAIAQYVERIDFTSDDVFAVTDCSLAIIGAAHLAFQEGSAELGLSVLPGHRRAGIGTALLLRAVERARNRFVSKLFVHCLAENEAMLNVARKAGMKVVIEYGDADAMLELAPASTASVAGEMLQHQLALMDYALKHQFLALQRIRQTLLGEPIEGA